VLYFPKVMNLVSLVTATLAGSMCLLAASVSERSLVPPSPKQIVDTRVRVPLAFEPNLGQAPAEVRWISRTPDRTFLLTGNEAVMVLNSDRESATVRMKVVGGRSSAQTEGLDKLASTSNYFIGKEPGEWRTAVPHYGRVRYKNVYPGIDVVYYSSDRRLEYDFVLAPGADPSRIELAYEGADRMRVDSNGDLVLEANGRSIRQIRPRVYQVADGKQQEIAGAYRIREGNHVEFALAKYDRNRELVIDPVLQYSTYLGQDGYDAGVAVATDQNGDILITGVTNSTRFPTTQKAQQNPGGDSDAFIAKFSAAGQLVWMSYLGGFKNEIGRSIAVDQTGNAYVVGYTESDNFPIKNGAYQQFGGVFDAFLVKISPDGQQFLYSTYIGGSAYDDAFGLAVNSDGDAYVTGMTVSFDFPVRSAFQTGPAGGGGDIFVTKLSTTRSNVFYSTYVGGNGVDGGTGIAIDNAGNAYVTGGTTSSIFPVMAPIQGTMRGVQDAFLFKLNPAGNSLVYATFLGGTGEDNGFRVAVDGQGSAYLYGYTKSTDFPVKNAFQAASGGLFDVFLTKFSPAGDALVYSTYLGGNQDDFGFGNIVVDAGGTAYISGYTKSANFPTRNPMQGSYGGGMYDAFVARLAPQGNALLYSSYIGGSGEDEAYGLAVDRQGQVVLAGRTSSPNLPQATGAFVGGSGEFDIFLAKLSADTSINFINSSLPSLTFAVRPGTDTAAQTIALTSSGQPVTFSVGSDMPFVRVSPMTGATPATLTLSIDAAAIPAGVTSAVLTINAPAAANGPITIPITVNLAASITSTTPASVTRGTDDASVTLTGMGFQNGLSARVNGTTVPSTFVNPTTVRITIPGSIRSTAQSLQIVIFNADGTQLPAFQLPFATAGPVVAATGIVNAATNLPGPVVPGEIISITGTGFGPAAPVTGSFVDGVLGTQLGEIRVLVDGVSAPIVSAGPNQVSAIVPYSVLGRETVAFEVEYQGQRSTPVRINVGPANPGIFTQSATGTGQAAAVNQDGSVNSATTPAQAGSVLTLFATGEGLSLPTGPDGRQVPSNAPKPIQQVSVTIGGVPATVEYAGGSPGSVAGLLQVNVRIPAGVPAGATVPVVLRVESTGSREGVTVAIR
jgi:uncharacterized protein (TIGR03437 family)